VAGAGGELVANQHLEIDRAHRPPLRDPLEPTVLAGWTATLVRALTAWGYDGVGMAEAAGIDPADLEIAHGRVPLAGSTQLWETAAHVTGNEALGLEVARHVRPATFHSLSQAVLASPTLREGLERMARFSRVVADPAEATTLATDRHFSFVIRWRLGVPPPSIYSIDGILATVLGQCQLMLDDSVWPLEARLLRPRPRDTGPFERNFRSPVRFDAPDSRLVFDRALVEHRLPAGEGELARRNDEVVTAYLAGLDGQRSTCDEVRAALVAALPSGPPSAPAIASALAMSPRSLQRHLRDEGTSFRDLLQEVRCDVAKSYLRSGTHTVAETAVLLGFGDTTAFSRAFKRWTGVAPSRFR